MGYLRRDPEISRGIELTEAGALARVGDDGRVRTIRVPVVGRIAAGEPIEAVAGTDETIDLTDSIVPENAYILKVKGKSMIDDLIDDGDLVVVEPRSTADNGDIVVALLTDGPTGEGQATLKRIYREKGVIRLQPANAEMKPIYVDPENLLIQGKVVSVIRLMP
jgi:repressor LexA